MRQCIEMELSDLRTDLTTAADILPASGAKQACEICKRACSGGGTKGTTLSGLTSAPQNDIPRDPINGIKNRASLALCDFDAAGVQRGVAGNGMRCVLRTIPVRRFEI